LGEETNPRLTSFQVVLESDRVFSEPSFLQTKESQFLQPLFVGPLLQTLQFCCPSLDMLQELNVFLVVEASATGLLA